MAAFSVRAIFSSLLILFPLIFGSPLTNTSPPALASNPQLSPQLNGTLTARNSECFSRYSFPPVPQPGYVSPVSCDRVIRSLVSLYSTPRTFGSVTDLNSPWVWPSLEPGWGCYVSLHSRELGDTIELKGSDIAWKAMLILRDCHTGLYGGRKWIGESMEFYVRVASGSPDDVPE